MDSALQTVPTEDRTATKRSVPVYDPNKTDLRLSSVDELDRLKSEGSWFRDGLCAASTASRFNHGRSVTRRFREEVLAGLEQRALQLSRGERKKQGDIMKGMLECYQRDPIFSADAKLLADCCKVVDLYRG